MSVEQHLISAAAYIAVAESGDSRRAAYEKAADEILAARAEDPSLTQAQIGKRVGKDQTWVGDLLRWRQDPDPTETPFVRTHDDPRRRYEQRQVPTRPEDRVEMAQTLMADPEVAKAVIETPTAARSEIRAAVSRENRERRERAVSYNESLPKMPLPMAYARILGKIAEWNAALRGLAEGVRELPPGHQRHLLLKELHELRELAAEWIAAIDEDYIPYDDVIEGETERRDLAAVNA